MGTTKKSPYGPETLNSALISKALGHPARMTMYQYLRENEFGSNSIFQGITTLSKTAISQHMVQLERAGIISSEYLMGGPVYHLTSKAEKVIDELCDAVKYRI